MLFWRVGALPECAIVLFALAKQTYCQSDAPTVTIDIGTVVGKSSTVPGGKNGVKQFLGIPFAVSPPERYSPPQPATPVSTPIQATAFSDSCIQQFNGKPLILRNCRL